MANAFGSNFSQMSQQDFFNALPNPIGEGDDSLYYSKGEEPEGFDKKSLLDRAVKLVHNISGVNIYSLGIPFAGLASWVTWDALPYSTGAEGIAISWIASALLTSLTTKYFKRKGGKKTNSLTENNKIVWDKSKLTKTVYQDGKSHFAEPKKFTSLEALTADVNHYKNNTSFSDYKLIVNENHADGMTTGLFADEEDGYNIDVENLEETKYVLKGSAPSADSSVDAIEEPFTDEPVADDGLGDLEGLEDAPAEDKPFDDEPFDAGVDADEDTDPAKYIQQLSGKLGQSLRQYSEDEGQPDFDLEKFAVNSVLSATHTGEMDKEDQRDIINQVKGAGNDEEGGEEEVDVDVDVEEPAGDEEALDFGEEGVEEIVEELPLSNDGEVPFDGGLGTCTKANPIDIDAVAKLKDLAVEEGDSRFGNDENFGTDKSRFGKDDQWESYSPKADNLQESEKKRNIVEKLRLMENAEPMVEPKPITKPETKPARPMRETDRPFSPKRRTGVQPDPKASKDVLSEDRTPPIKIINSKFLNSHEVIIKVLLNGEEVDIKFESTGDLVEKPLAYDEPWIYEFKSVDTLDGKEYIVNVEYYGHPDTNLELGGMDDYIEEV